MPRPQPKPRQPGGRPRKFREPSKAVTITLPLRVLDQMTRVDPDRAMAITRLVDQAGASSPEPSREPHLHPINDKHSVLIVPDSPWLKKLSWLQLVPIGPQRYLLAVEPGTPIERLELTVMDLIEEMASQPPHEIRAMELVLDMLRNRRRDDSLHKAEILFLPLKPAPA